MSAEKQTGGKETAGEASAEKQIGGNPADPGSIPRGQSSS